MDKLTYHTLMMGHVKVQKWLATLDLYREALQSNSTVILFIIVDTIIYPLSSSLPSYSFTVITNLPFTLYCLL
jgi:hypothetical protein